MSGFVTAAALVRPSKSVLDLEASSVIKRMKDKAFARAVSRDDLRRGAEELGLPLEEHIANVIASLREQADALGPEGHALTRTPRASRYVYARHLDTISRRQSAAPIATSRPQPADRSSQLDGSR